VFQSLSVALVLSRLDYCNSILFGPSASQPHSAPPVCSERCCTAHVQNPTIRAYYSRAHQPSLAARPRAHLLQTGCHDVPIHPRHYTYLQSCFTRVADMTLRRRLRSSASHRLEVPPVRLSTVYSRTRAFPVATMPNDLPLHVTSAQSLAVFYCFLLHVKYTISYRIVSGYIVFSDSVSRLSSFLIPTRTS